MTDKKAVTTSSAVAVAEHVSDDGKADESIVGQIKSLNKSRS